LNIWPVADVWDAATPVGADDTLTFALHFSQQAVYARFVSYTLNGATIYPRHIWEGTGKVCLNATAGVCNNWNLNIHSYFGYAYDEVTNNGVPATDPNSFWFSDATYWEPSDDEVVGTGPFEFDEWIPGVSASLSRFEDYRADTLDCMKVGFPPVCQGSFFLYMHKPYIDGMLFKIYATEQEAVFALQVGEIDVISWSVPPEFVGDLLSDPNIGLHSTAEKGFYYLGYNMRSSPLGYPSNDPSQGDDGLHLRRAIAHVIDKKTIVIDLLQNFGVAGDQPVSPAFTKWYNGSVTKYEFNLSIADQILNDYYTIGGFGLGYGPSGYRNLPTIGDSQIEIICPTASYDAIRAAACDMIAENMTTVGLNAVANHLAFGDIINRMDTHNMDMWVLGWRIASEPPDYYHAFFHSSNAPSGQNYPGFQNATFDDLITQARAELDPNRQADLIKQCSGILVDALPYDVLYFKTNIEAYRSDRFVNWTVGAAGSIFGGSFWSWIGIHPPANSLGVSITAISSMLSGSNETVKATVTDPNGNPLSGAPVRLLLNGLGPLGNLSIPAGEFGTTVNGTTDINGDLFATFFAPYTNIEIDVIISAQALGFGPYSSSQEEFTTVRIYPLPPVFLSVLVDPSYLVIETGATMSVNVSVTDQDNNPVNGALVNAMTIPSGPTLTPDSGATTNGAFSFLFQAPSSLPGGEASKDYYLIVNATLAGYLPADSNTTITVMAPPDEDPPEVSDVTVQPDPQMLGGPVNISARVADASLDLVTCQIIDPNLIEMENLTMQFDATNDKYYRNRTYGVEGTHQFTIWASDLSSNMNSTGGSFQIIAPPPTISNVEWQRLSNNIPTNVNISAGIESSIGIDSAWVHVWDPGSQEVGNFSMRWHDTTNRYWRIVPAALAGGFQFRISANDNLDNWVGYDGMFQIVDDISPTADAGPDQVINQGGTAHFDGANSSDNWGIDNYTWRLFNGSENVTLYGPLSQSEFTVEGSFTVVLEVRDPAGNSDEDSLIVEVIVTDSDGDGLSDWEEENVYGTEPLEADTDGDGMNDGDEVELGRDPLTSEKEDKPFLEEYWWAVLLLVVIVVAALVLTILFRKTRRKPEEELEEESEESE
ncbi:MAG: ABC transporter substrate-binding protein, partial [Thermoplasmata archaeon]